MSATTTVTSDTQAPNHLGLAHATLARLVGEAEEVLAASRVTTGSSREQALRYCLERGRELAVAIHSAAASDHIHPAAVLGRALYETFLWTAWIQLSETNAERFRGLAHEELLRQARKNLERGLAVIRDKRTERDVTSEFLAKTRPAKTPRPPKFDRIAQEAGLAKLHTAFYGLQSLEAHGSAFGLQIESVATSHAQALHAHVAFANAMIKSITKIVRTWLEREEITPSVVILDLIING